MKKALFCLIVGLSLDAASCFAQSLYNEANFKPLVSDNKAFRVGDILTVQVFESSSASTSSDTDTRRKNSVAAELARSNKNAQQISANISGEFDGGGRTQRANRLLATISVSVIAVLPNGDLSIFGSQTLTVNDEVQKVSIEGRVRQVDISDGNMILSNRIADAKIHYVGEGDLTERQRRAWWRKFMDWLGL